MGSLFGTPRIKVPVQAAAAVTPTDVTAPAKLETPSVNPLVIAQKTKKKLAATNYAGLKIPASTTSTTV